MEERLSLFGLSKVRGLGPRRLELLLAYFGSARDLWEAKARFLYSIKGIPPKVIDELINIRQSVNLAEEIEFLAVQGITVYTIADEGYPERLKNIHTPPIALYVRGCLPNPRKPAVAIVGARRATPYGLQMAEDIGRELGKAGVTIISGMARGIDSAAHKGCILGSGITVAVLGTGVDVAYPRENRGLMERITQKGAVISEYPPGTKADKGHFPMRNRIISGLSDGVLVVEAAETSGSLITADLALEQGRDVFAVPGFVTSPQSKGTNRLIKQGAKLVESAGDILEEFGIEAADPASKTLQSISPEEHKILERLSLTPLCLDELIGVVNMTPAEIISTLTFLELKGLVKRMPGQKFIRLPGN